MNICRTEKTMKKPFLEAIMERVLLGDGALGTYFYDNGISLRSNTDLLNIHDPELVLSAHQDYIRAGAEVIETNTFGANRFKLNISTPSNNLVSKVNEEGVRIARQAAGDNVYVAGSIGPSGLYPLQADGEIGESDIKDAFLEQMRALLRGGVDLLILETFSFLEELLLAIKTARKLSDSVPIIAQMVFPSNGLAINGIDALTCAQKALEAGANGFGSNCGRGVKSMLAVFERLLQLKGDVILSAFPNAGLPEIVGDRTIYSAQPAYMAQGLSEMIKMGARLVGGCCGTTPAHIFEFKKRLRLKRAPVRSTLAKRTEKPTQFTQKTTVKYGGILEELPTDRLPVLVELDPPTHLDIDPIINGAQELKQAGTDAITIAENPLAILRSDNLALGHLIQERAGINTVLHLTCRDRNILGLQTRIMGAHSLGIKGILAITGDPANASDQPGTSGVFDLDSIGLVKVIDNFNHGLNLAGRSVKKETNLSIGVAFSYRPSNPSLQIRRLEQKAANGAHFVMTQPLFDASQIEAMMEKIGGLDMMIFPGIFPLISARNADFLHNEVPGISVPKEIRDTLWKYEKVEDQRKAALEFAKKLIENVAQWVDGLYIISPLNKWEISRDLVEVIRTSGWKGSGKLLKLVRPYSQ